MVTKGSWSVRTRLTLIAVTVAALSGLALSLVATLSLYGLAGSYRAQEITNAALETINLTVREQLPAVLPQGALDGVQVLDPSGRVLSSTPNLRGRPRMAIFVPPPGSVSADRQVCDSPEFPDRCMVVVAFRVHRPGGDWIIYAADDIVPWYVHPGLFAVIVGTSLALVLLAGVGAYQTVNRALAPVNAIRSELAEITATDLGRRVPVPPAAGEIKELAVTINQTLDRLEAAAEQQRRFASDASHDLRSPLTAMRAQVEEALHYPEDTDWKAKAGEMLASLDRLQAIVSDLLMLARLDSGAPMARQSIDLGELCREEMDHRRRRVEIVCDAESGVMVQGSRLRLARLMTNLLDNAERHAASRVVVTVAARGDTAVVEVLDDGAGIARDQWEVVFRRFTRLDASRNKDAGGTGLGLPIAREVAEAHGGTLVIEESERGARFVLRLPLSR
ncbi:sensor histidine kinase [Streptosporangium saharense]|uniref:histidine kinase n=1 Tax=Streptosporangium saharense TaxID=1706840 RepID=A0A7W7QMQ3_9ACTN|nr:HAMP domain-containing sensor histidine kinase [Streptosporangium saharense]MBB4916400.1 signal transduction histidine kinase [Streptosporangium saharense]